MYYHVLVNLRNDRSSFGTESSKKKSLVSECVHRRLVKSFPYKYVLRLISRSPAKLYHHLPQGLGVDSWQSHWLSQKWSVRAHDKFDKSGTCFTHGYLRVSQVLQHHDMKTFHQTSSLMTRDFCPSFSVERNEPSTLMVQPIGRLGRNKGRDSVTERHCYNPPRNCQKGNLLREPTAPSYIRTG